MQYFSENLKKERLAHNWTQSELADRARVNVSSITAYEQGRRMPPLDVAHRLAEALGVPLDRLCRDKDAKRETFRTLADVAAGFLLLERKGLVTQVGTHWQGPNPGDPVLYEDEVDPQNPGEACRWADFSVRSDALAGFFAQLASLQAMERQNPSANLRAAINGWILSELPGLDKISLGPQEDREVKS